MSLTLYNEQGEQITDHTPIITERGQMYPPGIIGEQVYLTIRFRIIVGSIEWVVLQLHQAVGGLTESVANITSKIGSTVLTSITFIEIMGNEMFTEAKLKVRSIGHDMAERLKELSRLKEKV